MSVVRRESVGHASRTVVFSRSRMRCCVERMCGCVCVLVYVCALIKIICPRCSPFLVMNKTNSHRWRVVFGGLTALRMAQGTQRRSLAVSGARLRGWLVCDVFQTLLVSMILSAGQQKGHPSRWRGLPLRRGRSSWMVRVRE